MQNDKANKMKKTNGKAATQQTTAESGYDKSLFTTKNEERPQIP